MIRQSVSVLAVLGSLLAANHALASPTLPPPGSCKIIPVSADYTSSRSGTGYS